MFCCHLDALGQVVLGKPPGLLSSSLLHCVTCIQTVSRSQAETPETQFNYPKSLLSLVCTGDAREKHKNVSSSRDFPLC